MDEFLSKNQSRGIKIAEFDSRSQTIDFQTISLHLTSSCVIVLFDLSTCIPYLVSWYREFTCFSPYALLTTRY